MVEEGDRFIARLYPSANDQNVVVARTPRDGRIVLIQGTDLPYMNEAGDYVELEVVNTMPTYVQAIIVGEAKFQQAHQHGKPTKSQYLAEQNPLPRLPRLPTPTLEDVRNRVLTPIVQVIKETAPKPALQTVKYDCLVSKSNLLLCRKMFTPYVAPLHKRPCRVDVEPFSKNLRSPPSFEANVCKTSVHSYGVSVPKALLNHFEALTSEPVHVTLTPL